MFETATAGSLPKPAWLAETVATLSDRIQVEVNRSADVNPINDQFTTLRSTSAQ